MILLFFSIIYKNTKKVIFLHLKIFSLYYKKSIDLLFYFCINKQQDILFNKIPFNF